MCFTVLGGFFFKMQRFYKHEIQKKLQNSVFFIFERFGLTCSLCPLLGGGARLVLDLFAFYSWEGTERLKCIKGSTNG